MAKKAGKWVYGFISWMCYICKVKIFWTIGKLNSVPSKSDILDGLQTVKLSEKYSLMLTENYATLAFNMFILYTNCIMFCHKKVIFKKFPSRPQSCTYPLSYSHTALPERPHKGTVPSPHQTGVQSVGAIV